MATGREHNAALVGAAVGVASAFFIAQTNANIPVVIIGVLFGTAVSPDMDVDDGNISYYYARKIGMEWYWKTLWKPYALATNHRGFSHLPIMSTILRLIYIAFPATILLSAIFGKRIRILSTLFAQIAAIPFLSLFFVMTTQYPALFVQAICGLIFADIIHLILDL